MKAISIHQPFASLIVDYPEWIPANWPRKRVENRTWASPYVGVPVLIHASKTTATLDRLPLRYPMALREVMPFGALVGTAVVTACIRYDLGKSFDFVGKATLAKRLDLAKFAWVNGHPHSEGPICWVLEDVQRFRQPIPYKGAQGFFDVPTHLVIEQITKAMPVNPHDVGLFK